jgi:glycosyltransferase involved in cell wall biosynthesis
MKVLLVAGVDLSLPGGLETHVRELARGLSALGLEVEVYGRPPSCPPLRMVDRIEPGRYGLIHDHTGNGFPPASGGPPVVRTLHFCVAAKMAAYVRIGRLRTLVNPANWRAVGLERARARTGTAHIAVSARVRDEFARWHGADPARVTVIPNGASFATAREPRARMRHRYGIAPDAPVALTVGRDDFVKGFGLLSRAWAQSGVGERGARWVTVGGRASARAGSRIVTGPVPPQEVVDWIHASDFGAFPSYYEGCSLALLEMLAGGLYTLAHDVGNAAEVIRPGGNGEILPPRVFEWAAALRRLASDPPARPEQGLDPAFGWGALTARTEAVYRTALAGAPDR